MLQPAIIYGTAWKKERTTALVVAAVLNGFRAIDTACQLKHYREDLVGQALAELREKHGVRREDLFLQTKFTSLDGQDKFQPLPYDPSQTLASQVRSSFDKSLENLRTTYLDSYVLHSPMRTLGQTLEAWKVLMSLQDEGRVRLIGVSNTYDVQVLEELGKARQVQVVQNRWYEGNHWDSEVLQYCRKHSIQYQSFWTLTGSPTLLAHPSVTAIARAAKVTPAQTVYAIAQSIGAVPLSGTTNERHMREDVAVGPDVLAVDGIERELEAAKRFVGWSR